LEEDALFRGTREAAQVKVGWTKISRYVETDEFFLLSSPWPWGLEKPERPSVVRKQDRYVLFILPKRAFNSGEIERLRDLLQRKLSVWAKNPSLKADPILTV
jgi:YcxB-like protein